MTHLAGIAGPTRFTDLRHVRKTVTFDGTAGNGAVGTVDVFTITGRAIIMHVAAYSTNALASAGGGSISYGVTNDTDAFAAVDTATDLIANRWWGMASAVTRQGATDNQVQLIANEISISIDEDMILTIFTADVTDGTLVFDAWYLPITDDGALAAA